jgi:septal ring factor EnvC (AmiA/AmiB activator)
MSGDHIGLVVPTGERNLDPMICFGGLNRIDQRFALIAGLGLALPMALSLPLRAQDHPAPPAQDKSAQGKPAGALDALKQHQQELETLRGEQSKAAETEAALKREIEQIGDDRRKLNQALIDTAARLRGAEAKVAATEDRLKSLDADEDNLRKSLDARRALIGEVLAALQRIGRRPPPALIASPEDALQAVRTAMVLGAVLPEMRHDVEALANNLAALVAVRKKIAAERDRLKAQVASLAGERTRMAALIDARQKQQAERESALAAERQRASELAQKADNLKDLIAKLEQGLAPATRAAREAARRDSRPAFAALHDPGRLAPAVAFVSLHGKVPLPVNGIKIKGYGAPDGVGGVEKGISIATRASAEVTAPADGWVVYAGPFRSYGQLLILNAGGGYHILLAGMERISVDLGQFVLTGEPVAVMGNGSHIAAILATGSSQPVLYVEFRKDGTPVDPGPWWAAGEGEKVRG